MWRCLVILLLTYNVGLYQSRPSQALESMETTWSSFLTRFDDLFELPPPLAEVVMEVKTPFLHSEFCGKIPVVAKSPTAKIVGGQEVKSGQIPWQAAVVMQGSSGGSRLTCGGTILTERAVLTAAHCLTLPPASYQVLVGKHSSDLVSEEAHQQNLLVEKYVKHSQFESTLLKNDIALVFVKTPYGQGIWWNDWVLPACLFSTTHEDLYKENMLGTVSGWGLVEEGSRTASPTLLSVDIQVQSLQKCQDSYSATLVSGERQFCAGHQAGGKDSCSGDSGGPFVVEDEVLGRFFVTGVVSYGVGCGRSQYPGVYTRVDSYLPWIREQLGLDVNKVTGERTVDQDFVEKVNLVDLMQPLLVPPSPPSYYYIHPVCAGSSRVLNCPSTALVQITQAYYGRDSGEDCPVPWLPTGAQFSCSLPTALSELQSYCNGRMVCTIGTTTRGEGGPFSSNPCMLQRPYVQLNYTCQEQYGSSVRDLELGTNTLNRRSFGKIGKKNYKVIGDKSRNQDQSNDFPDKKSAAWHSRPWERGLGNFGSSSNAHLHGKTYESEQRVRQDGQRLRFLV